MAIAYNPTPIDWSQLATMGQNLGGALGQNNFNNAMRGALRPDGTFDFEKGISILAQRNPAAAMKLQVDREAAQALAGYRTAQAGAASANTVPDDIKIMDWARQNGYLPAPSQGPYRLGPSTPTNVPGVTVADASRLPKALADKILTPAQLKEQEAAGTYAADAAEQDRKRGVYTQSAQGVLTDLNKKVQEFDTNTFENALGPWQGSDALYGYDPRALASQAFGAAVNALPIVGGSGYTQEVRDQINASVEAVGAAIKPLVKLKGDPWTDSDQQRLINIMGGLARSNNKKEFARRLGSAVDRINAAWGLNISADEVLGMKSDVPAAPAMDMATDPPAPAAAGTRGEIQPRSVPTYDVDPVTGGMAPASATALPGVTKDPRGPYTGPMPEGTVITNGQQRLIKQNGKWVPAQ